MRVRSLSNPGRSVLVAVSIFALSGIALSSIGCGSVPSTHFYTLNEPYRASTFPASTYEDSDSRETGETVDSANQDGWHVEVSSFLVDPPYDRSQIVYRVGEDAPEVGFYNYHQWAAPLGRMLPVLVAEQLRGLPGLASVRPASSIEAVDENTDQKRARLDGRLVYLEEIDTPAGVAVRVRLDLLLTRTDGTRLWEGTVHGQRQARAESVPEVVHLMREALRQALDQARDGLSSVL